MDIIPVSLAIAQAAKEDGMGKNQDSHLKVMLYLVSGHGQVRESNLLVLMKDSNSQSYEI